MSEPLSEEKDAFGRLLLDHLAGEAGPLTLELDDGRSGPGLPADVFFAEQGEWPAEEQQVFEFVRGRVLDVGCGAGRHSLEAQRRGLDVVAIDISPGAVEVCGRRGARDVRVLPLAAVDASLGIFDTVLMMCGNFGLVGTAVDAALVLRTLHGMTALSARIALDSVDPHYDNDSAELAYQERNRACGRFPGQVTIRLRYQQLGHPVVRAAQSLSSGAGGFGGRRRVAACSSRGRRGARVLRGAREGLLSLLTPSATGTRSRRSTPDRRRACAPRAYLRRSALTRGCSCAG